MNVELIGVEEHDGESLLATVDVTDDEGKAVRLAYIFPKDTMEWRAAEYDIDPSETEVLLDIILFEPHIKVPPERQLYVAESHDDARSYLLGAIAQKKAESARERAQMRLPEGKGKSPEENARARVLELSHLDPEVIVAKREMVQVLRGRLIQARRARAAQSFRQAANPQNSRRAHYSKILKEMNDASDPNITPGPRQA